MSAGRAIDDTLHAGQAYSELRELNEPAPIVPAMPANREDRPGALWIDQFELRPSRAEPARTRTEALRLDRHDRAILVAGDSLSERAVRAGIVVGLLTVTVLGLMWIGGSNWIRVPAPTPTPAVSRFTAPVATPIPSSLPGPAPGPSDPIQASTKGDRLPVSIADLVARESTPKVLPKAPESTKLHAPTPTKDLLIARPQTQPQREEPARRITTPVPETRPATIPGWTVREVVGDSAVLEGPQGARRVARGESVPGLGKVETIVRWGNRWIVTTERGLISTN
jgi:hypothetical protein